jgi:hypothetical protein
VEVKGKRLKLRLRYTMTALLAAILLIGLPLAWVRHNIDERTAYRAQMHALLTERGNFVRYHARLPRHPWYGFFEDAQNPNQLLGVTVAGWDFGDDDLPLFDPFPNLEEIELRDTHVTDVGLLYLARKHRTTTPWRAVGSARSWNAWRRLARCS